MLGFSLVVTFIVLSARVIASEDCVAHEKTELISAANCTHGPHWFDKICAADKDLECCEQWIVSFKSMCTKQTLQCYFDLENCTFDSWDNINGNIFYNTPLGVDTHCERNFTQRLLEYNRKCNADVMLWLRATDYTVDSVWCETGMLDVKASLEAQAVKDLYRDQ